MTPQQHRKGFDQVFSVLLWLVCFCAAVVSSANETKRVDVASSVSPSVMVSSEAAQAKDVESSQNPPAPDSRITLEPGELRGVAIGEGITRVAVGNPDIVDVSVLSGSELLLKAKAIGTTNLILWDQQGQHNSQVEVGDTTLEHHITRLVGELSLPNVQLKRENSKLFLMGQVERDSDLNRLQQIIAAYGGQVTNLVTVVPPIPPPPLPPPVGKSVGLTVQLVEMSRNVADELGVDWFSSLDRMKVTEAPFSSTGPSGGLRQGLASLGESFRIGSFSRTGLEADLNMLARRNKVRILAEPKLVAGSGKEAKAFLGVQVPVITGTSVSGNVVTQAVEFKNVGVEMTFTPTILHDEQSIQLAVRSKVSSIDATAGLTIQGTQVPGFRVRESQTEIVTQSGQTLMIAGLLQEEDSKALSQVPAIGSIPVLGNLFRSTDFARKQTELVVVVAIDILGEQEKTAERTTALEQALSSAEVVGFVQDPTLRYVLQVQDRIAKAVHYPVREKELGLGGEVKLRLHLFRDGTLERAVIAESSGIASLDTEALRAADSQAPYPPFSSELVQQDLWLELPVIFRPS